MSRTKINPRTVVLLLMIFLTGFLRIVFNWDQSLSPISNFSPLGALALFGGAYFTNKWKAFGFPLLTLFISDLILSFTVLSQYRHGLLYGGWYWTYGAFTLMTLAGKWIIKKVTVPGILFSSLVCTFIHWIITDFGVWLNSTLYAKTIGGFITCLIAAIPFEFSFIAGTLIYSAVLFGLFEWIQKKQRVLRAV
jgi:hypothetical protein